MTTTGANDLTTLDSVKSYLRLNDTDIADDILQTLITNVSAYIETYTNRHIKEAEYTDVIDGAGQPCQKIMFANYPAFEVSALTIDGIAIPAAQTVTSAGYRFNSNALVLNGYYFTAGFQNVSVTYTAGYEIVPYDLQQACNELVALRYREMERIGEVSKSMSGETVTFSRDAIPPDVLITLNQYKKVITV